MNPKKLLRSGIKYFTSSDYRFLINAGMGVYNKMPDEEYLKRKFKAIMRTELDLENPKTFNEKLQWLKLHDRRPEYTMMADKVAVRDYIAEKLGEEYLIPCLGVWDDPDDIDFDALPDQFVLKCNHNSGLGMCICTDKSKLNIKKVKKELRKGMKQDYYLTGREWQYKNIPRKIIAEQYMVDESGKELKDYKIFCFNGKPQMVEVDFDRFISHKRNLYTTDWKFLEFEIQYPKDATRIIEKPMKLEKMLEMATILADGLPHVRADFYIIGEKIYFGEITFCHECGFGKFTPNTWDEKLGNWMEI